MKVQPVFDYIFVRQHPDQAKTTTSGIYIPETADLADKPAIGDILGCGPGKLLPDGTLRPLEVKEGDKILYVRGTGHKVKINQEEHLFMREEDILGILK